MCPYDSKAQARYFHAAEKRGEISASTVAKFDHATKDWKHLPERVKKQPAKKGGKRK